MVRAERVWAIGVNTSTDSVARVCTEKGQGSHLILGATPCCVSGNTATMYPGSWNLNSGYERDRDEGGGVSTPLVGVEEWVGEGHKNGKEAQPAQERP